MDADDADAIDDVSDDAEDAVDDWAVDEAVEAGSDSAAPLLAVPPEHPASAKPAASATAAHVIPNLPNMRFTLFPFPFTHEMDAQLRYEIRCP